MFGHWMVGMVGYRMVAMVGLWMRVWCKDMSRVMRHWGRVVRHRVRGVRSGSGMVWVSLIFNISVVAVVVGIVRYNLDPAVGQRDPVLALRHVLVPRLLVGEVVPGVVVLHGVAKLVLFRDVILFFIISTGSMMVVGARRFRRRRGEMG